MLESRQRERARRIELDALMQTASAIVWIAHDPECHLITGNKAGQEFLRLPERANLSKPASGSERPSHSQIFQIGQPVPDQELPMQAAEELANRCWRRNWKSACG